MTAAVQAALVAATSSKSSSSSSVTFVIFLVVIGVVGYFFLLRPQQQKARRQREAQSEIGVGDTVVTVGGIVGTVVEIDSERATIITGADGEGPGQPTRLVMVRNAIARKVEPATAPDAVDGSSGSTNGSSGAAGDVPGLAAGAARHPGYGGVPDGDAVQGGAMQGDGGEEHERTDGGSAEGEDR